WGTGGIMFYIRADGNARTGAGHIMRCLTIAEEIKKLDEVTFLCADEASAALVKSHGQDSLVLGAEPFSNEELQILKAVLGKENQEKSSAGQDRILIDSYLAAPAYVGEIGKLVRTACMDDMCRQVFPADIIINYNAFATGERYRKLYGQTAKETTTKFLVGREYIPVRRQFIGRDFSVKEKAEALLITTGGGDADNLAGSILQRLLQDESIGKLQFHVVSGAFHPHYGDLMKLAEEHQNITIHKNVTDMAELMCSCDIAVTAGGTTIYELCALGVPFVCFSYADNQDALVSYIGDHGVALSAGSMSDGEKDRGLVLKEILQQTVRLVKSEKLRKECCADERKLVDGNGAARLAVRLYSDM
ncbi:MAG: UDP-2,4-diacetamido-2,4,6-trideoxy-beta-L-altropyranose hydrolase, partial [Lachnospiraceae bacterium]